MAKAVFLDRDGTVIEDTGYVAGTERVKFLPGSSRAIKLLNENDFKVIVVSNQAGVARGYYDEDTVKATNRYIQSTLAEWGAIIDMFYYCPHHQDGVIEKYRRECHFRKPNPGMIEQGAADFDIDLKRSFVVGDHYSDVAAGHRAGCRTVLISNGNSSEEEIIVEPDWIASDLKEAVDWVLTVSPREEAKVYGK